MGKGKSLTNRRDTGDIEEVTMPEETFGICGMCNGKKTEFLPVYLADGYCVECLDIGGAYTKKKKLGQA